MTEGASEIGAIGLGGVGHLVVDTATAVSPYVAEVEPVSHLVGSGATKVKRRGRRADVAGILVSADDPISVGRASGELCVPQQPATEVADPVVEVVTCRPSVRSALAGELHGVVGAEAADRGGHAQDAIGRSTIRIEGCETEFDLGIGRLGPDIVLVGIGPPEILIQNVQLRLDLSVGNVLGTVGINNVEDHGNGHDDTLAGSPLFLDDGRPLGGMVLNLLMRIRKLLEAHELRVLLMGRAGALNRCGSIHIRVGKGGQLGFGKAG